jgi:hypothetical protein
MKNCLLCGRVSPDDAESCSECGIKFPVWKEPGPIVPDVQRGPGCFDRIPTAALASYVAVIHFVVSLVVGFIGFAEAWGGALSDSYHEQSGASESLLVILDAPVALVQWFAMECHPDHKTGFGLGGLFFMACIWSVVFGWMVATVCKRSQKGGKP